MQKSQFLKVRISPDLKAALRDRARHLRLKESETTRAALALGLSVLTPKPATDDSDQPVAAAMVAAI